MLLCGVLLFGLMGVTLLDGMRSTQAASGGIETAVGTYRTGAVLVGLRPGASLASQPQIPGAAPLLSAHGIGSSNLFVLSVAPGQEAATVAALRRNPAVRFAELDYLAQATGWPDDPALDRQWALPKIGLPAAWQVTTGTADIVVAAVDSGLYLGHPDLASKVWSNPGEIPGNGIDDDLNGKVDDVNGWHFYQQWTPSGYIPAGDANVSDEFGHGTHVSGIIGAATNNAVGIAGGSWGARVMPVRVLDQYGNGWYSDITAGILYAADNGARIINLSLGGARPSTMLCEAVKYARETKGSLVVAATGNSGGTVLYPAACADALAVAATDRADNWATFSNNGPEVDLAAPGVEIYSTWPWLDGYFTKSGTSMAAPHVSGVAALVWSHWPAWSNVAVSAQITQTAVDVANPGWDPLTGWGRLDAAAALEAPPLPALTVTPTPTQSLTLTPSVEPTATQTVTPTPTESPTPTATPTIGGVWTPTPSPGASLRRWLYLPFVVRDG